MLSQWLRQVFLWDGAAFWFTPMARVVASPRALIAQHGLQSLVFVQKGNFPKLQKFFRRLQACKFEGFLNVALHIVIASVRCNKCAKVS
jgi:hypothetical protein